MNDHTAGKSGSYSNKLALNAASLAALYALPMASQAAVVHVTTPLTLSIDSARAFDYQPVDWDVDGNSVVDFRLEAFRSIYYTSSASSYPLSRNFGRLNLNDASGGLGMVQNTGDASDRIRPLTAGETVGLPLSAGRQWGPSIDRLIMSSTSYMGITHFPLQDGSNLIGFRFDDGGNTRYGWAELVIDESLLQMSIVQWAYEDSGSSIQVGQVSSVPAPPAALSMLSGLALGAGSMLRRRRSHKSQRTTAT